MNERIVKETLMAALRVTRYGNVTGGDILQRNHNDMRYGGEEPFLTQVDGVELRDLLPILDEVREWRKKFLLECVAKDIKEQVDDEMRHMTWRLTVRDPRDNEEEE